MKKTAILLLCAALLWCLPLAVYGADVPRLTDGADLLSPYEEEEILQKLDEISTRQEFDIVIVTVDSLGVRSPESYADDWFDDHGFGYSDDGDGILLLVSMEDRDTCISTCGEGIDIFTDEAQDEIWDEILPDLRDGYYADAFLTFADACDTCISEARNFDWGTALLISVVGGLIVALITVGIMKGKMRSVRRQTHAAQYVKSGSLSVTESRDLFLYRNVTCIPKPTGNSSSGRSGTRISSSGRSHGGSSRKF